MDDEKQFRLRYVGSRFDGARLPVDVLSDLPAFRDLLVAFAKHSWLDLNADRQRVPKGFDKGLSFDLVGIEDGSAIPALAWNKKTAQANLAGFTDQLEDIVDRSFKDIVHLIDEAANNRFPQSLSSDHIRALNKLGAGLHDGERIEFVGVASNDGNIVFLDSERRKKLITKVRDTYQTRFDSTGKILGVAAPTESDGYILASTIEYGDIHIPLEQDQVWQEFKGTMGADVQFQLQIELDNHDRFKRVIEVLEISVIDAEIGACLMECRERLAQLASLQAGWDDDEAAPISAKAIEAAERFLLKRPSYSAAFKIFPTEGGAVLFEFEASNWDYSIEFGSAGAVEMYGIQLNGSGEMKPVSFDGIDDLFMEEFDRRVAH